MHVTYIDLFAGAGGLSDGFVSAGYQPIAHVEMDADACYTLKTRESYYYLKHQGNLSLYRDYLKGKISREELYNALPDGIIDSVICETMSNETMPSIFNRIDIAMKKRNAKHIDLILGGPPCQAYSMVGRARKNMVGDPRNTLYEMYFQAIEKYKPTMFVFENVPGLLTAGKGKYLSEIIKGFEKRGYQLDYKVLNVSDYGVLQNRKRIILIGWKADTNHGYPNLDKHIKEYKVSEILEDLPELLPGEQKYEYKRKVTRYLKDMQLRTEDDILTWHIARPNLERDREIYRLAVRLWKKAQKRLKYTDIPEVLATHNNRKSFLDRFKVIEENLSAARTVVAHISKDGHYYIHPDIKQARSLSVREAARIQSFPDNFFFEGSRTSAFKQIGNAVPPIFAKTVAEALLVQFGESKKND